MINFFLFCLFLIPWIFIPSSTIADPFRLPQATFFDIMCFGMIYFSLVRGLKTVYYNKYLAWFSLWVFLTIIFTWYFPLTLTFNNQQGIVFGTIPPTLHFILGLWLTYIVLCSFERRDFERIAKVICLSSVLITLFCLMQLAGFDPFANTIKYNHPHHFVTCLDNPNIVGNYLCLAFPFFFCFKELKYTLGGILVLAGIILSHSVLAICVTLLVIFVSIITRCWRRKRAVILLTILLGVGIYLSYQNVGLISNFLKISSGFSSRTDMWTQAIGFIKDNPLFGQGLGRFRFLKIFVNNSLTTMAHNDWLERVLEIGVLGIGLMILVIINSFRRFNYRRDNILGLAYLASFVSFLLLMFGSFPVETAPTALLGLIGFWGVEKL